MTSKVEKAREAFLSVWEGIDHEAVAKAILAGPEGIRPLPDYDFEDAKLCVIGAAERWLVRDLREWSVVGLEREHRNGQAKAVLDLEGVMKRGGEEESFKPYAGLAFAADWKTTRGTLDKEWEQRYADSWQWKVYNLLVPELRLFFYRGIKRTGKLGEPPVFRELVIDTEKYATNVITNAGRTLVQVQLQINELRRNEVTPWPQNMPSACHMYNRECPYLDDCSTHTEPPGTPEDRLLSYSRMKTFMACNERYRREVLDREAGEDEDESEDTIFGSAVHRGLASVWGQAFGVEIGNPNENET